MVDRVIKIQEQQLHNSCPVAGQIKYHQQLAYERDKALAEYERMVKQLNETISDNEKTIGLHLSKIYDLESQIEKLKDQLKEQVINKEEVKRLMGYNSKLEELLSSTRDALENVLDELQ